MGLAFFQKRGRREALVLLGRGISSQLIYDTSVFTLNS